ncbi:MAG: DNA translocase FtsK, partial [Clostridia bacterium]|nr:DNA translocase FtsK [Clostridia bacterium]
QNNQPFANQPVNQFANQQFASNQYSAPQSVVPPVVSAKPRNERNNENATLIKNGQPTSIAELENADDRKIPNNGTGSRLFSEPYVDSASKNASKSEPQKQMPKYEMLKPTLDNPRPAYVDTNPTQGGAMPSEPAPIRQQVTGGDMSRAAIQGTTDIAKQSGKDKESAEMQARIQNIRQTMKETPNLNQYERDSKLREEKVRSSQNRGLQNIDTKKAVDSGKKANDAKYAQVTVEEAIEKTKPRRPYTAPPVSLLKPPVANVDQGDDYEQRKDRILSTLNSFGITGEVIEVQVGPTFTLYKLHVEMPRGRTISYISSLENDISMKIEAESVRIIAPIPGQDAVGIEVPNKNRRAVNISEIIQSPEFNKASDPCTFVLGKDIENKGIVSSVDSLPHVLIAGATGAGKSCGINSLIVSLLYKASPDDVRFILVDPKRVELSVYAGIPHLLMDEIICDADKAIRALTWAEQEMRRRMKFFGEVGYRNIESFNANVQKHGYEKMPRIMVIVDEFADLMSFGGKTVESLVNAIARLARAVGIHLVLATQRPSTDVISGTIKNNFPSRVAFKVTSSFDSKTILDSIGAEKLLGKGDMIFMKTGKTNQRIQ